ncbi:hypothetical protein, partial [Acinetobacter sp.]|uniref:hypothetical protein n=1 Tax=Acinetobacter sp. TaxID=472 RepID=UPI002FC78505
FLVKTVPKFSALERRFNDYSRSTPIIQAKLHAFINFSLGILFKFSVFNSLTLKRPESPAIIQS